jgi:hypothetical protein
MGWPARNEAHARDGIAWGQTVAVQGPARGAGLIFLLTVVFPIESAPDGFLMEKRSRLLPWTPTIRLRDLLGVMRVRSLFPSFFSLPSIGSEIGNQLFSSCLPPIES